jgi:hypothetical protein
MKWLWIVPFVCALVNIPGMVLTDSWMSWASFVFCLACTGICYPLTRY